MSKNKNTAENTSTETAVEVAPVAAPSRGKKIMLTPVDGGAEVARADFIKERFAAGVSRSDIVKELEAKFGHKVAYQIVFAATKPAKAAAPVVTVPGQETEAA